jgi:hypothetical protein
VQQVGTTEIREHFNNLLSETQILIFVVLFTDWDVNFDLCQTLLLLKPDKVLFLSKTCRYISDSFVSSIGYSFIN